MGTTVGAALTGQLVIALTVVAVVVMVLVFAVLLADDARPAAPLTNSSGREGRAVASIGGESLSTGNAATPTPTVMAIVAPSASVRTSAIY